MKFIQNIEEINIRIVNSVMLLLSLALLSAVWGNSPIFTTEPDTNAEINSHWSYAMDGTDLDNDVLSFSAVSELPEWLSLDTKVVGVISDHIGDGSSVTLPSPTGIAIDSKGNFYIAPLFGECIKKVTPEGEISVFAGNGTVGYVDGDATSARFHGPIDVAIDKNDTLYVADYYNHAIRKITPQGVVTTLAGGDAGNVDGLGTEAKFNRPTCIAIDNNSNLFVTDYYNHCIKKITPEGLVTTIAGSTESVHGFVDGVGSEARLNKPVSIAIDNVGNLYFSEKDNHSVRKIIVSNDSYEVVTIAGNGLPGYINGNGQNAKFNYPRGIAVDGNGYVYVADLENNRIRRITPEGDVSTFIGGEGGYLNGIGENAKISHPAGFAVVGSETIYVADRDNYRIRKIVLDQNPVLSGVPEEIGEYPVTLRVSDEQNYTDQSFIISVKGISQSITFNYISNVTYGDPAFDLTATASSNLTVEYSSSNEEIASVSGNRVTINGAGTVTITVSQDGDDTYSPAATVEQSLTINKKEISIINVVASDKVYDGNLDVTISGGELSGLINSDEVNITTGTAQFTNKNAGNDKPVIASGFEINGADSWKYTLENQPLIENAEITQKTVSITGITFSDKEYDGNETANLLNSQLLGIVSGDDITLEPGVATFENKNVGTNKNVTVIDCQLTGEDSDNYSLSSNSSNGTADITAKSINISGLVGDNKIYDGTTSATVSGIPSLVGLIENDDVDLTNGSVTFSNENVGTAIEMVATGYSISGDDASNYLLSQPSELRANITEKPVTLINVTAEDKVYDGTTEATLSQGDLNGVVLNDEVSLIAGIGNFVDENVGSDKTVIASGFILSGAKSGNYTLSSQPVVENADIIAKTISIANISVEDKVYDGNSDAVVIKGDIVGVIPEDDVNLVFKTASFTDKSVGENKTVTLTEYLISGADSDNYSLIVQPIEAQASITSRELTVNGLKAENKIYDGNRSVVFSGEAELTGVIAGDDVTYAAGVATFEDPSVGTDKKIVVNSYSLSGFDALNYSVESYNDFTADITPKSISVENVSIENKVYDGTRNATVLSYDIAGVLTGDIVSCNNITAYFNDKNVGNDKTVTMTIDNITGDDSQNYKLLFNEIECSANVLAKDITLAGVEALNKVYDGTTSAILYGTATVNSVISGDNVSPLVGTAVFEDKNVGEIKNVFVSGTTLSGIDAPNYRIVEPCTLTSTITPLATKISGVEALSKHYDKSDVASISGGILDSKIEGDTVTIVAGSVIFEDGKVGKRKRATANGFTLSGEDAKNYLLTEQPVIKSADILPKEIAISNVIVKNKIYDGTNKAEVKGGILNGIIAGDDVDLTEGSAFFADKNVGNAKIVTAKDYSISGSDAYCYFLSYQPVINKADIVPAELSIIAHDKLKTVGSSDPVFTVSYEGFLPGEDSSLVTGLVIHREIGEEKGEYYITPSGAVAANYDIKFYEGIFTIDEATEITAGEEFTSLSSDKGIIPFQNPVSLREESFKFTVILDSPANVKIKICDLLGNVLDEQDGFSNQKNGRCFYWDMKNRNGVSVGSGTYVIVAKFLYEDGSVGYQKRNIGIKL